jgi:hypothetical protein
MSADRCFDHRLILLAAGLLLAGCDQSINYSGAAETQLTGMHCDAKQDLAQCQAGDLIVIVEGRERELCDWGWQIVHESESDDVLCVYRGLARVGRDDVESVK